MPETETLLKHRSNKLKSRMSGIKFILFVLGWVRHKRKDINEVFNLRFPVCATLRLSRIRSRKSRKPKIVFFTSDRVFNQN